MPIAESDKMPLWDIVVTSREICERMRGISLAQYQASRDLQLIVERLLIIVGEATSRLSREFRDQHPEIPWQEIIGQRHVLAHGYDVIDDSIVYETCQVWLPRLLEQLELLMPEPPDPAV